MSNPQKLTNPFYVLLSLPSTAMGFALCVQISALSWILSTKYNLSIEHVGLVWLAGPLAGLLAQPIVGLISDNVWFWGGRRRPFILIGGVTASLMLLALPFLGEISEWSGVRILWTAVVVALTLDLAINVGFNPTRSIIADLTPEGEARTKGFTWMQTISGMFGVLAYVIGAVFGNYALIYFGVALVLIFNVVPAFLLKEPRELGKVRANQTQGDTATDESIRQLASASRSELRTGTVMHLLGYAGLIFPLGNLIGPLVLWLAARKKSSFLDNTGKEVLTFQINYTLFVIVGVILCNAYIGYALVPTAIVIWLVLPIVAAIKTSNGALYKYPATLSLRLLHIYLAHAFTWLGVQTMFVFMFAYAQGAFFPGMTELDETQKNSLGQVISISFLVMNIVGFVLPVAVLQPLAKKIGLVRTHTACIFIMALGYAAIVLLGGGSATLLYALMAVVGIGWAAVVSLPFAIMSDSVDKTRMGLFMGIFNLSVVIPQILVSVGIGKLVGAAADKSLVFIICAGSLAVSAVLWALLKEDRTEPGEIAMGGGGH